MPILYKGTESKSIPAIDCPGWIAAGWTYEKPVPEPAIVCPMPSAKSKPDETIATVDQMVEAIPESFDHPESELKHTHRRRK